MQKTKIEWADYTSNPIKGYCPNNCSYCYAHRLYNRYHWDKTVRFDFKPEAEDWKKLKKPSRIFLGSTIDMYHSDIHEIWVSDIILESIKYPQHTFITLTKYPENLSTYYFPRNWWLGTTIHGNYSYNGKAPVLASYIGLNKIFVSFEPILDASVTLVELKWFDWIIIGGKSPGPVHKKEWIDDIVRRADDLGIPVFIKNNAHYPIVRKEFPYDPDY